MTKFTFVTAESGDWQALYIDGKLATEGHGISAKGLLHAIRNILPNKVESYEVSNEIAEIGMPTDLNELSNDLMDY